ncbi:hypothetical protein [Rhodopseudomonas palustris]|uniref:Transmembrane protein n=1 Tax=Rhodopseudomonas palustris (strain BisB18) TaxID=316056 RepID=Q20YK9_RHOPB
MRNRAKPYFLVALPAVPYLFGVGLQVSGVTNIPLSVTIFEVAAFLAAAVVWAFWSDWHVTAFLTPNDASLLTGIRRWSGLPIGFCTIRTSLLAAFVVLFLSNAAIYGFVNLAEDRRSAAAVVKTGARLFARVGAFTREKRTAEISVINDGDVIARMGSRVGTAQGLYDRILSEREEDSLYQLALQKLPPIGPGIEIPVKGGRTVEFESNLTDAQFDTVLNGTSHYYVVTVIAFNDEQTPNGETNLASICNRFNKRIDVGLVCVGHNESRMRRTTPEER